MLTIGDEARGEANGEGTRTERGKSPKNFVKAATGNERATGVRDAIAPAIACKTGVSYNARPEV